MGRQYAKIAREMPLWGMHQGSESRNEGQWSQFHRRGSPAGLGPAHPTPAPRGFAAPVTIGPRLLELQPHDFVIQDLQPVVGQGRTQDVLAQGDSALLVVGGDTCGSMEVEPGVLTT